ncbi:hypothetical protein CN13_06820 [Petrotoga sp. HKA.pet.4.5]|uniref:hypothetical protein n=1 Tax=unclassified Petrotoga TaxID=2620614 RepID=UPI000EF16DF9|nr:MULTISPECIES: hypothetical protein [unclassified Petrotoga]RLL85327.1 hypothetical protein BZ25_03205 [Petrotoga sp. Shatin.DS.tank11.9.2.9.3]RLL88930.1 hypothetical protein CN13_06820 [Petrotoga sp. HKA.pet.4.5]
MRCKYLEIKTESTPLIGEEPYISKLYNCTLKMRSKQKQVEIYQQLFEKGLEGSFITDRCPIAAKGNWNDCPFFEVDK